MKRKILRQIWPMLFICFIGIPKILTANSIDFISGDFQTISKKSLKENKFFFVSYSAKWCAACEILMESANANKELVNYIDQKFIAVKANIDEIEGLEWQTKFEVKFLPTIIIFSPDGKEFARSSGGISSSKFLSFLQKTENQNGSFSILKNKNKLSQEITNAEIKDKAFFRIQIGLYSNSANAVKKIDKVKNKTTHPIYYREEKVKGKLFYQVVVGDALAEKEALQLQKDLAKRGVKSYVLKY